MDPIVQNDTYVSCTTFDGNGNITAISKKYPKASMLKMNGLFPRDLRKIDTSSIEVVPLISVKATKAILINMLYIKAIIEKDKVIIFDTSDPVLASKLGVFMYDLEMKLKQTSNLPYEFRALESMLISIIGYLETEIRVHLDECGRILAELENQIERKKLQELLIKSKNLSRFYQKTLLIRNVFEEILDNDEDLAGMHLTNTQSNNDGDYEDLEMIMESYFNHCEEFVQQAGALLSDIKTTEQIANIILDINRNSLMIYELKLTVYTLGVTVATLIPAFYGMNLKNFIEESYMGFAGVVVISIALAAVFTMMNFKKLHKVQRLAMVNSAEGKTLPYSSSPVGAKRFEKFFKRLVFRRRNLKYDKPTLKEIDALWRMINDNKTMK